MPHATARAASLPARDDAAGLPLQEQLSRDARTRVVAAALVVLVHAAYPPGHPALASLPPDAQRLEAAVSTLVAAFPVNAFVLLAFLGIAARLGAGVPGARVFRTLLRRLGPVQLFWAAAFLAAHAAVSRTLPSPRAIVEGVVLGSAADHLYFIPILCALGAAVPLLWRASRTPARAALAGAALALSAVAVRGILPDGAWSRALAGALGFAPFALAGLALGRWWRGAAPDPARSALVVPVAGAVAALSAAAVIAASLAPGAGAPLRLAAWLGANGVGLAVPVLLLAIPGRASPRTIRLAGLTLGVYLVHPFFVQALKLSEARVPALAGLAPALILPNAAIAAAASVVAVRALARTPLRRLVT